METEIQIHVYFKLYSWAHHTTRAHKYDGKYKYIYKWKQTPNNSVPHSQQRRKHTKTFDALKTKRVCFAALDFLKLWSAGDGTPQLRTLDSETTSYQPFLSKSVH